MAYAIHVCVTSVIWEIGLDAIILFMSDFLWNQGGLECKPKFVKWHDSDMWP